MLNQTIRINLQAQGEQEKISKNSKPSGMPTTITISGSPLSLGHWRVSIELSSREQQHTCSCRCPGDETTAATTTPADEVDDATSCGSLGNLEINFDACNNHQKDQTTTSSLVEVGKFLRQISEEFEAQRNQKTISRPNRFTLDLSACFSLTMIRPRISTRSLRQFFRLCWVS